MTKKIAANYSGRAVALKLSTKLKKVEPEAVESSSSIHSLCFIVFEVSTDWEGFFPSRFVPARRKIFFPSRSVRAGKENKIFPSQLVPAGKEKYFF